MPIQAAFPGISPSKPKALPGYRISVSSIQSAALWLLVFLGFLAIVEPAPYEIMFLITGFVFCAAGLRLAPAFSPMIIALLMFNLGGAFALIPFITERDAFVFIAISFYMGVTSIFYAGATLDNTLAHLKVIRSAWICAGFLAATCGMLGYFDVAGSGALFTIYGRASGTFKDPNVFGPFLSVPAVLLAQSIFVGENKRTWPALLALLVILGGVFFSFSRGAWGATAFAIVLTGCLLMATSGSSRMHSRIFLTAIIGGILLSALLAVILSVDSIRDLFEQRFALTQVYDVGAQGRFGKIGAALTLLLDHPNGLGPLKFDVYFPEAPHNVYVNAFSAYGWLGGISYFCLIATTLWVGWAGVWKRTPWQGMYIAFWSATFFQILQGFQIDSDHWRHLWLLIGLTWGTSTASFRYEAAANRRKMGSLINRPA